MLTALALASAIQSPAAAALPADLVGEWRYTSIQGTTHWDSSTGAYKGHGGGNSSTLVFAKNGTFKEYVFLQTSPTAGWTTKVFTTKEGKATVSGETLKFIVTKGHYKSEDNRVAKYNIDRAMTEKEAKELNRTYRFSVASVDAKPVLTLELNGSKTKYARVR